MRKQDGFTLLELVVVLAILGILLAIAVPNYLGINESADNNAQGVQAALIAKSLQQEFADDFATVDETPDPSVLMADDSDGLSTIITGFKIDDNAPIRGHLCFTYLTAADPTPPYFDYEITDGTDTLTLKYVKSTSVTLDNLATVNYY